jgi:hypothetical protein
LAGASLGTYILQVLTLPHQVWSTDVIRDKETLARHESFVKAVDTALCHGDNSIYSLVEGGMDGMDLDILAINQGVFAKCDKTEMLTISCWQA